MKLFHISDLHIGKQLNLYDLSEVQRDVFAQFAAAAERERPDVSMTGRRPPARRLRFLTHF